MNYIKYIFLLSFCFYAQLMSGGTIDFYGTTIEIEGSFELLAIHGTDTNDKITFTDLLDKSSLISSVKYKIDGSTIKVTISGESQMRIDIPENVNIICKPNPIAYEGSYTFGRDAKLLHIQDTAGEVEINADGYNINLLRTSGSLSIVSYENIRALLPNLDQQSIISLDSYLGDILLRIPHVLKPKIKATAPKGSITIKGDKQLFDNRNADGNQVILHTESGKQIFVTSIEYLPDGPSHPELRDGLIKMFIEDQGKNRMDNDSRKELTAMGYGPFIESVDDIYKGHKYTQKHQMELDKIIAEYGFPNERMVGFQFALGAVRQIIFQSDRPYFEKYKQEFKELFGDHMIEAYESMHK